MGIDFKYKKAFLIIAYGVLLQLLIVAFYEINALSSEGAHQYLLGKGTVIIFTLFFIGCLHTNKLVSYWTLFFNTCFLLSILIGEYLTPGHYYALIQFMFISVIVFDGFPKVPTLLLLFYVVEYSLLSSTSTLAHSSFHVYVAVIFSWLTAIVLEGHVKRVKYKKSVLDRKLRYKGIRTDLFLHDLKNKLQPFVSNKSEQKDFKNIIKMIQRFNSFNNEEEVLFSDILINCQQKNNINGNVIFTGSEEFFFDQMDLETILFNLLNNSQNAAELNNLSLVVKVKNKFDGFTYEDNAGGMSDEQHKYFCQKEIKPYVGHEKNGLGLLLIKKLVECQNGRFIIKKIPHGTRFVINY